MGWGGWVGGTLRQLAAVRIWGGNSKSGKRWGLQIMTESPGCGGWSLPRVRLCAANTASTGSVKGEFVIVILTPRDVDGRASWRLPPKS